MLVSLMLIPVLRRYADQLGFLDIPDERKVHTIEIPRVGGIAMVIGVLVSLVLWIDFEQYIKAYIIGIVIIAVFGICDDRVQLGHKSKFLGQLIAALLLIFIGDVKVNSLPFLYDGTIPDLIAIPFTLFALLGITNAINLSDGLDGLAGGTSLFSLGVIALLAYQAGDTNFVMLCLTVIGCVMGFLRFNTYPAMIFMGDTGSQFLGFSLGVLVIWLSQKVYPVISPAIAILILGLPLLDTFYVMVNRIIKGGSPFKPDKTHIHHKLLSAGMHHYEAVFFIYLIQSTLVISAYLFRYQNDILLLTTFFVASGLLIFLIEKLNASKLLMDQYQRHSLFDKLFDRSESKSRFFILISCISTLILLYWYWLIFSGSDEISLSLAYVSIATILLMLTALLKRNLPISTSLLRIGMYMAATIAIYLLHLNPQIVDARPDLVNGLFMGLIICTLIGLIYPQAGRENITPLDYIIIFMVLVLIMLPAEQFVDVSNYAVDIGRLFVLFYLSESILMTSRRYLPIAISGITMMLVVPALSVVY